MPKAYFSVDKLPDLHGKVYIVTGGNSGIGKVTVAGLVSHGARVYMGARSEAKATAAIEELRKVTPDADIRFLGMDLNHFSSVMEAVQKFKAAETKLHGLINNAGIMATAFAMTDDGYEQQFQTNYLSHWLLTYHLLPVLQSTAAAEKPGAARIVNVSSNGHLLFAPKGGISFEDTALESAGTMTRYGQSKLANVLHANQLNTLYGPKDIPQPNEIWTGSLHPGVFATNLLMNDGSVGPTCIRRFVTFLGRYTPLMDDESKGALSPLWIAASSEYTRELSGSYVVPYAKVDKPSEYGQDPQLAEKLWNWTEDLFRKRNLL